MLKWQNGTCLSILRNPSLTLSLSLRKDRTTNPSIYFLNNPLEDVQSFKLLVLTLSHDLSWTSHISKFASKARPQLGILRHTKSFLGTTELLSTYKAFICSLMECCVPHWAGSPASHLAQFNAMETKAFKTIGISRDEAESMGLSLCHRQVSAGGTWSTRNPLLVKLLKFRTTAHLHSFIPTCGTTFHTLFNLILLSRSSKQLFTTISGHPPSKTIIFSTPIKPPQPTPTNVLLSTSCPSPVLSATPHR